MDCGWSLGQMNLALAKDLWLFIPQVRNTITSYVIEQKVFYYAPNFEKVDGAYCFWSVRGCVRAWVGHTFCTYCNF